MTRSLVAVIAGLATAALIAAAIMAPAGRSTQILGLGAHRSDGHDAGRRSHGGGGPQPAPLERLGRG